MKIYSNLDEVELFLEGKSLGTKKPVEVILLIPGHCDPTVNLHDWYIGVRGMGADSARVESIWPVAARGALF